MFCMVSSYEIVELKEEYTTCIVNFREANEKLRRHLVFSEGGG